MTRTRALALTTGLVVSLVGGRANAQDASRKAAAQQLFDDALKLMDQGNYAEACPKLARSQDLAPSGGTLLNLGDCYEKNGQLASAWTSFRDAASRAASAGVKAAENAALERANRIEPKLLRIKISLARGADIPSLEVRRDGLTVKRAEFGLEVPIDPGSHKIEASGNDRKHWSKDILVSANAPLTTVTIPALEPESDRVGAATPAAPTEPETGPSTWNKQKTIGVAVAGGGAVLTIVGSIFGLKAISNNSDALTHCRNVDGTERCDPTGLSLTDDAKSDALLSTIFMGVGVAAIAGGAVIYFMAPKGETPTALRVTPLVGKSVGGVALGASF